MRTMLPVSPGEMLDEKFLKPLDLTKYRLAKDIGVPPQRIGDIVDGKRAVTADTDLPLQESAVRSSEFSPIPCWLTLTALLNTSPRLKTAMQATVFPSSFRRSRYWRTAHWWVAE